MRPLPHPYDKIGHAIWFGLMAYFMSPLWAVIICAISLEIDQWWTWHEKGWNWTDCLGDIIADGIGIGLALILRTLFGY